MSRRSFIGKSAVIALGTGSAVRTAAAQSLPEVKWRLASGYPRSLDIIYNGAESIAKQVAEATNGKFQIRVYAEGELVPANQVVDAVEKNSVDAGHVATSLAYRTDPTFAFSTALPFGLTARQQAAWMYHGGGLELMREFMKGHNMTFFPAGNTGVQMGGFFRKEIKTVQDLSGLKLRVEGLSGMVLEKLGVIPQIVAPKDIYTALVQGTVDAAEYVGPYDDQKLGLSKVARYYYAPGFWENSSEVDLIVNLRAWNALPKEYQVILATAAQATNIDMLAKYDSKNVEAIKHLIATGTQLRAFSVEIMTAAFSAARQLYDELAAKNANFSKVYLPWRKFQQDQVAWGSIAENRYEYFMANALKGR